MAKWDGRTEGSLLGYKIFVFSIEKFGLPIAYFFCQFVSIYYLLFSRKVREGLVSFYSKSFGFNKTKSLKIARKTCYNFGVSLIDRFAMSTKRKHQFSYDFNNESALLEIAQNGKGGILISAHLGNWEIAGNLIHERITNTINVVVLDNEVEKIKVFLESRTGGPKYNLIPIKNDLSHLILIKHALDRNELIAIHADRVMDSSKSEKVTMFGHQATFPLGPFILASKFKTPVSFVFAVKTGKYHYSLSATNGLIENLSPEELLRLYSASLSEMILKYPEQWYNFFDFYAD